MPLTPNFPSASGSTASQRLRRSHRQTTGVWVLVMLALLAPTATAQFPVIELTAVSARFGQAGASLELRVSGGNHLDQIDRLIFSAPGITAELLREAPEAAAAENGGKDAAKAPPVAEEKDSATAATAPPKWGHFRVSIPAGLRPARYEVRAAGAYGISNPRIFSVTRSPVLRLDSVSQQPAEPTPLDDHLDSAGALVLDHQGTAARIDYYRVSGSAKQSRRVSLDAQRIDSRMIGQIKLIGPDGRLLQTARGADGFDPSVTIPAGQSGPFTIAVHDFLFRGGEHYFYGLRIQTGPLSADSQPLEAVGPDDALPDGALPVWDGLEAVSIGPDLDAQRTAADQAQLDRAAQPAADRVTPPCVVASAFDASHRDRSFAFDAPQGTRLAIEVISQRAGQPTDPWLRIERQETKPDGELLWHAVATEDDPASVGDAAMRLRSKDPVALFTAPATATYRINIRNLDTGRSLAEEPRFWLALREPSPSFGLVAMLAHPHNDPAQARPRGCQIMRGDTQSIRVLATRRDGFAGPIELSVQGLPAGLTCQSVTIAANQAEAVLSVLASGDAASWSGAVEVIGKAIAGELEIADSAAAATILWGSGEQRDFTRARLATKLVLSVTDQQQTPVSIGWGGEQPAASPVGASLSLPITLTRREGGGGAVILRPRNLPPGVTAGEVTVAADKSAATLELKIAADAKPGSYSIWLQGETKVKFKPITQPKPSDLTVFVSSTTANIRLTASP